MARWCAGQLLHRPGRTPDVADLVGRLLAVQAQDAGCGPAGAAGQGARAHRGRRGHGDQDLSVVRDLGAARHAASRHAADLSWLLPLVGPPRVTGSMRRLAQDG